MTQQSNLDLFVDENDNKNSNLEVWTACHIDHKIRFKYLRQMIESAHKYINNVIVRVSLSYDKQLITELDVQRELEPIKNKALIYIHKTKMKQIDHLIHIKNNCTPAKNAWILFMDDDDLILSEYPKQLHQCIIGKHQSMIGLQILPDGKIKADFSGYTAQYEVVNSILDHALNEAKKSNIVSIADLTIQTSLHDLNSYMPGKPIVFRRIWNNPQTWKQDMLQNVEHRELAEIKKKYEALYPGCTIKMTFVDK